MQPTHEMVLMGSRESGADEWMCPICGRRILVRWTPMYVKVVLVLGDESVTHVGGKGGVQVSVMDVSPGTAIEVPGREREWLLQNGIDWDGESA